MKTEIIICQDPSCKSHFSIYEGIKNGLKKVVDHISPNIFLSNDLYNGTVDIKVGFTKTISLDEKVKKVYKVEVMPIDNFLAGIVNITNSSLTIFTSLPDEGNEALFGKESKVMLFVHGKNEDYEVPWLHMLQYALEQLRAGEYLTSILLSEIAFETFVDTILSAGYSEKGLDSDSISRFLMAIDMPKKVNPLMENLYQVKLSSDRSAWKNWQDKVLKMRNAIAHGTKVHASKEEAILAYETVIDSIFYLAKGLDEYFKSIGREKGLFYIK
jgi:hypothetical protein